MSDKETLKITLEDLEEEQPVEPEAPLTAEQPSSRVRAQAEQIGRQVSGTVKGTADKITQKIADSAAEATSRSAEAAREKMGELIQTQTKATADAIEAKVREIDWKQEAQKGAEGGLRWLSQRLDDLAGRLGEAEPKAEKEKPAEPPEAEK